MSQVDPAIENPKRDYDKDGYYAVPKSDIYPGMIAKKMDGSHDLVAFGDPELGRKTIEDKLNHSIG